MYAWQGLERQPVCFCWHTLRLIRLIHTEHVAWCWNQQGYLQTTCSVVVPGRVLLSLCQCLCRPRQDQAYHRPQESWQSPRVLWA